ncbi:tRNA (adenosine(37)-N6)-threonylcarbamoyltransferase complex dimerization subunit type 1 TsaB [Candidatus Saccharibacteria bacterium]|nr:MAG: tRNA (adenosine(37)-N6)-threonylcarbamoyltransferase complex dimerization subunit type 1 TsaB [Candidatus Saccharibacteria bacterium]
MIILTLRTDNPEAEVGLYDDDKQLVYEKWTAHRQLAETIHLKIKQLLDSQAKDWHDITGLVVFQGPGSFTGLRIGLTVSNALAQGLSVPIVATQNPRWIETGVARLIRGENDTLALPFYGAEVHITPPKK